MQSALKVRTTVLPGHRVEVTAPELPEGEDVEVSIRIPQKTNPSHASARFHELAARWRRETATMSSVSQMAMHPAYQEIIGMGSTAIPLILSDLQHEPAHWFWALRSITGEDPVPPNAKGKVSEMTRAWLDWGSRQGFV